MQEAYCGRHAKPPADHSLEIAYASLRGAVVIRVTGHPGRGDGLNESFAKRMRPIRVANRNGPISPAIARITWTDPSFRSAEVGQNVFIPPSCVAELGPMVEI